MNEDFICKYRTSVLHYENKCIIFEKKLYPIHQKKTTFMFNNKLIVGLFAICCMITISCNGQKTTKEQSETEVLLETTAGEIRLKLYNETPGHRDNFIKNVKEGKYDGVTFHRVIRNFMIQTGDPYTRPGEVKDTTKADPTIKAEIKFPKFIHKRGIVAAARENDDKNPQKQSDMFQFYIVTGRHHSDESIGGYESARYNKKIDDIYHKKAKQHEEQLNTLRNRRDRDGVSDLLDSLLTEAQNHVANNPPTPYTSAQRRAYKTHGGAPWLDGEYTIFGEVTEGMKVVQEIEKVKTGAEDRPLYEIRITKASIVE